MWLLDTSTLEHHWFHVPPTAAQPERYAILSHVWNPDGEQTFQDIRHIVAEFNAYRVRRRWWRLGGTVWRRQQRCVCDDVRVSAKIRNCCAFARAMGYRYVWIDTCCIDKTSSEELSEAINTMFRWYSCAAVCFAFLEDVGDAEDPASETSAFRRSRWFTRGWTLQELIAPQELLFLSRTWTMLGTKQYLADVVEVITGVERAVLLLEKPLVAVSVACRMSWASRRETTRVEDEAYSLLGLFGICMATIYGEGRYAFIRLQEEILKQIPDQSIFVWGSGSMPVIHEARSSLCEWWDPSLGSSTYRWPPHTQQDTSRGNSTHQLKTLIDEEQFLFAPSPLYFQFSGAVSPIMHDIKLAQRLGTHCTTPHYLLTSFGLRTRLPLIQLPKSVGTDWCLAVLACQDKLGQLIALVLQSRGPEFPGQYSVGRYAYVQDDPGPRLRRLLALHEYPSSVLDLQDVVQDEAAETSAPYRICFVGHAPWWYLPGAFRDFGAGVVNYRPLDARKRYSMPEG
ncbi:hypothetical protein ONZ51_g2309 [Trametes cubensis]|uniref:HET-domain-containing protein n=1 Tax=Trametes cubensis TaxID=1111947 RepID=A0AAD7XE14_9APHY|nr:hypothetical protein ONZ51_g2309 [Trametes cubensis]